MRGGGGGFAGDGYLPRTLLEKEDSCRQQEDRHQNDQRVLAGVPEEAGHLDAALLCDRPHHEVGSITDVRQRPHENRTGRDGFEVHSAARDKRTDSLRLGQSRVVPAQGGAQEAEVGRDPLSTGEVRSQYRSLQPFCGHPSTGHELAGGHEGGEARHRIGEPCPVRGNGHDPILPRSRSAPICILVYRSWFILQGRRRTGEGRCAAPPLWRCNWRAMPPGLFGIARKWHAGCTSAG